MPDQMMSPAVDDEDPTISPVARQGDDPKPVHRPGDQDSATRDDLAGEEVQPGINEASDHPN